MRGWNFARNGGLRRASENRTSSVLSAELARFFRSRRRKLKLSVDQIARRSGIKPQRIERFEAGALSPWLSELIDIAKPLRLSPVTILKRVDDAADRVLRRHAPQRRATRKASNGVRALAALCLPVLAISGSWRTARADDPPTSATDVKGNVRSFFSNLGKGVVMSKPYEQQNVWAIGTVQGMNYVCVEGIAKPQPLTPGKAVVDPVALTDCDKLVNDGVFRRIDTTATASNARRTSPASGGMEVCRGYPYPQASEHVPGDWICTNLRGEPVRVLNMKSNQYRELTDTDRTALRASGRNVGGITTPSGNWDKVDAQLAQAKAKLDADIAADRERAKAAQARDAALRKCRDEALAAKSASTSGSTDIMACIAKAKELD